MDENSYYKDHFTYVLLTDIEVADDAHISTGIPDYMKAYDAIRAAGYEPYDYDHVFLMGAPLGGRLGVSSMGAPGPGIPSNAWIASMTAQVMVHELTHSLGLDHSGMFRCSGAVEAEGCAGGGGDPFSTFQRIAHLTAFEKDFLGWLEPTVVTASGVYRITALELSGSALKIEDSTHPGSYYYVELKRAIGMDAYINSPEYNALKGVFIHKGRPGDCCSGRLLNMDPAETLGRNAALEKGETYKTLSGVTITVLSADDGGADIQVTFEQTEFASGGAPVHLDDTGKYISRAQLFDVVAPTEALHREQVAVYITNIKPSMPSLTFSLIDPTGRFIFIKNANTRVPTKTFKFRVSNSKPSGVYIMRFSSGRYVKELKLNVYDL